MPSYNSGDTIRRAIRSVLSQSYPYFELLILDACSNDETELFVKSINDERIRFFQEKDDGIYDAMNKGIKRAQGEWIYFLGADDQLYSQNVLCDVLQKVGDCDVIYGDVESLRFNGLYDGEFDAPKLKRKNICHQAIFFRKTVFQETGLFDLRYKAQSDWDHNFKWFLSPTIKKKYIRVTVAQYADNGFSSACDDRRFKDVKDWKYHNLMREHIAFTFKLKVVVRELAFAVRDLRFADAMSIILGTPRFFL